VVEYPDFAVPVCDERSSIRAALAPARRGCCTGETPTASCGGELIATQSGCRGSLCCGGRASEVMHPVKGRPHSRLHGGLITGPRTPEEGGAQRVRWVGSWPREEDLEPRQPKFDLKTKAERSNCDRCVSRASGRSRSPSATSGVVVTVGLSTTNHTWFTSHTDARSWRADL
jgi:hypothetical protein